MKKKAVAPLRWERMQDGSYRAGVHIGGDLARQWIIYHSSDGLWRAYFHFLKTELFIGAATATLAEQKGRVEEAAALLQHESWP